MSDFTYRMPKDGDDLNKMVQNAIESALTMKKRVQVAAVAILFHAESCGDYTQATVLVDGLGDGINGKALIEFFVKFGGLTVDEENGGFNGWSGKEHIAQYFTAAKETPWFTLKPVNVWAGYSLEDALQSLLSKHNNMLKKQAKLDADDEGRASYDMEVKQSTLESVVRICDFESIISETVEPEVVEPVAAVA